MNAINLLNENQLKTFTIEGAGGKLLKMLYRTRWVLAGSLSNTELGQDAVGHAACRGQMACGHAACRGQMACGNPGIKVEANAGEIEKMFVDKVGVMPAAHANIHELFEKTLQTFSK